MVNIVDLGLVYGPDRGAAGPDGDDPDEPGRPRRACPIIHQSKMALEQVPGVAKANIRLDVSPWTPAR